MFFLQKAHQLPHPEIQSGDGPSNPQRRGEWRVNRVLQVQQVVGDEWKWAVFVFNGPGGRPVNQLE